MNARRSCSSQICLGYFAKLIILGWKCGAAAWMEWQVDAEYRGLVFTLSVYHVSSIFSLSKLRYMFS